MNDLQTAAAELRRIALATILNMAVPMRFYTARQAAIGTASYETIIRPRGPLGSMDWEARQSAILDAGLQMGIVGKDADGKFYRLGDR